MTNNSQQNLQYRIKNSPKLGYIHIGNYFFQTKNYKQNENNEKYKINPTEYHSIIYDEIKKMIEREILNSKKLIHLQYNFAKGP